MYLYVFYWKFSFTWFELKAFWVSESCYPSLAVYATLCYDWILVPLYEARKCAFGTWSALYLSFFTHA